MSIEVNQLEVIFLGTGTSEGIPVVSCLVNDPCDACKSAIEIGSKDKRRNTSILIRFDHPLYDDGRKFNILVDCGKMFWEGALELFPKYDIRSIDAVILTHYHADAILGLDDLRDWTRFRDLPIPIYLQQCDLDVVESMFPYLVDSKLATGSGFVPKLDWIVIDKEQPFQISNLVFQPLEVFHGLSYMCLGYKFANIAYISDCSKIPDDVLLKLQQTDDYQLELLILDMLKPTGWVSSHSTLGRSIYEISRIRPKKTLFTGMCHQVHHDRTNDSLLTFFSHFNVELAYDGQLLQF